MYCYGSPVSLKFSITVYFEGQTMCWGGGSEP